MIVMHGHACTVPMDGRMQIRALPRTELQYTSTLTSFLFCFFRSFPLCRAFSASPPFILDLPQANPCFVVYKLPQLLMISL
jgi:hypothetical protein